MIFAISTDDRPLMVFPSETEAIAYCEGLDVEAAGWLFWDDRGNPLEPEFTVPNKRGLFGATNGVYTLVVASVDHHAHLTEALLEVAAFEAPPPLNSVRGILDYLARGG